MLLKNSEQFKARLALPLLEQGRNDKNRLIQQAKKQNVQDALKWLEKLYEEVIRKRLDRKEASRRLQQWISKKV